MSKVLYKIANNNYDPFQEQKNIDEKIKEWLKDTTDPIGKKSAIAKWAYEIFDDKGRLNPELDKLTKEIIINGKSHFIGDTIKEGKEKYERYKNVMKSDPSFALELQLEIEKILPYLYVVGDSETRSKIDKIKDEIDNYIESNLFERIKKEQQEKQKLKEEILNLQSKLQSEREKVSEIPGYLTTGSVGIISGFIGSLLKKKSPKLPKWTTVSIIPATVIPTAILTEYMLPEGRRPEGLSGLFKKEYIEKRGKHLVGKSLVGILTGLTTYGIMQKFIK
jgi:hypothetical protein